ncbi:hypothetical protein [Paraburkholderia silvatlantica]|uniref:Holin n=1 Tax=Paraburkholderia silvatlantica TaxID=321895 RepID=A0ABR6FLU0_9BURK|nr:hypothetical protein [Paraburkholderia silvatlantica]MBB2928400.1 hypothetical protein [Paraburkholderia silvatlantica]
MQKELQQMTNWLATGWGAIWSGWLSLGDHPLSWWVSVLTLITLLGTIKNQWFPRKGKAE